jgi:hypothetical protein
LLIFDLNKQFNAPVDEKEKNQEIFAMTATPIDDYVFMGFLNH